MPPTSTEALSALQTLQRYLEEGTSSTAVLKIYKDFYAVETRIESVIASETKQTKLTDYFSIP